MSHLPETIKNILLIGAMGSGKSAVGAALSTRISWAFMDTDETIEAQENKRISDIFSTQGTDHFRQLEHTLCITLPTLHHTVISTGGGIIINPKNHSYLKKTGTIIFLKSSIETLWSRLKDNHHNRPLLAESSDPKSTLATILNNRQSLYESLADITLETDDLSIQTIIDRLILHF